MADDFQNDPTQSIGFSAPPQTEHGVHVGTTLNSRYLVERELGRGGTGVVYLARDKQLLSKPVVIKVLLEGTSQDEWFKKKFGHEIEALARIDHPGVVGVLDAGEMPDGKPYLVMQFVEGVNLRSVMKPQGMELADVAHIMRQIGQALGAAHDKGVLHLDLKPENIMLQALGEGETQVKIIDFGVSRVMDSQLGTTSNATRVAGTLVYMAPEQLMGRPCAASDIYALGIIAYEMLTGHRPFNPESPFQLFELQRAGVSVMPSELRADVPVAAERVILRALSHEPGGRHKRARDFGEEIHRALATYPGALPETAPAELNKGALPAAGPLRVVLLYKRSSQPDERLMTLLEERLAASGCELFIDRHLTVGLEWAREIERRLHGADAVVVLVSAASVSSEMLVYEVQVAGEASRQRGKPRLLPVRVMYEASLPEPLAGILDPIQHAVWNGAQDDERVVAELLSAMETSAPDRPVVRRKLEPVGGAVPLDSQFYIVRSTDEEFRTAIERRDSIVLIKGARQMGKTSLLARGLQQAREAGARVVLTDFQALSAAQLDSVNHLLLTLAESIADQLELDGSPKDLWNAWRGANVNLQRYLRKEVLAEASGPLVWGLDEVDRLFTCEFGSEVFGLFRSWHNARALDPAGPWGRLTLAIAYATEAHLFISDLNQSPFNVGTRLVLEDFTFEQVGELNRRYGSPLKHRVELDWFFRIVGGHPYLVRKGLHEMATHGATLADLEAVSGRGEGPFGDHLRRILVLLARDEDLCDALREVLRGRPCPTTESFYRLRSAGVVLGEAPQDARPRCQLYASYLERHLLLTDQRRRQGGDR